VLISDFQRTDGEATLIRSPKDLLHRVSVGRDSAPNVAVVGADLTSSPAGVVVPARIAGSGIIAGAHPGRARARWSPRRPATWRSMATEWSPSFDPASVGPPVRVVSCGRSRPIHPADVYRFIASGERPLRVLC
jgi:hypothetical protein